MRISGAMNKFTTDVSHKSHSYFAESTVSNSHSTRSIGSSCYQLPGVSTSTAQNVNVFFSLYDISVRCRIVSGNDKMPQKLRKYKLFVVLLAIVLNWPSDSQMPQTSRFICCIDIIRRSTIRWHILLCIIENLTPCIRTYTFMHTYTE